MYCNKCGKHNPEDSNFCKSCGSKIVRVSIENKTVGDGKAEVSSSEVENNTLQNNEKVNAGLSGWLALVGLGLIVGILMEVYELFGYFPLLADTYDIPGYLTFLQFEFLVTIVFTISLVYLLYLYFKKNKNFPKYYIIFLISTVIFALLDHFLLATLDVPTQEQQKIINDVLSQNSGEVVKTIIVSIIWGTYMKKSKRVKATFIKDK